MRRSLRLFDVLCLGLNAIVGSGIFLLPDDLYREMGALSPLAFLLCGIGLSPIALCYAVASRNHDQTGGPYLYALEAFGVLPAFVVGFMAFATGVLSFAAVAAAAAALFCRLIPGCSSPLGLWAAAAGGIVFFSALNFRGVRPGSLTVNSFTIAKFGVLTLLVVTLFPRFGTVDLHFELPYGTAGIGSAVFMAVFAAQGFEVVGVPAGESRDPRRDVPRAILGSLFLATALYMVVQFVLVGSYARLGSHSDTPLADAVLSQNQALGLLIAVGGLVSTWGFVAGTALGTPRYLFALSRGGHLPRQLALIHPRFHSPSNAILLTGGIALLLVSLFDYRSLVGMSNVTIAVQFLTTCLAVARLQRGPHGSRYHLIGGPLLPGLGALMSVWIVSEASLAEFGWVAVSLSIGAAALWLSRPMKRKGLGKAPGPE